MKSRSFIALAGAFALVSMVGTAGATAVPGSADKLCADKLQNETLTYVNAVQKAIRLSIKNNVNGHDSKCSGGFSCQGGPANGVACTDNTPCGTAGGVPFQCGAKQTSGIASTINKAKKRIHDKFTQFCGPSSGASLTGVLGFPNSRCPLATDNEKLAACVLQGAIGDIAAAVIGDPAGEILARAATDTVPDSPVKPNNVCQVTLASVLTIGSAAGTPTVAEAGGVAPAAMVFNAGTLYDIQGQGVIGNNLTAPTQTFVGTLGICLITVTGDAGNGTPASGVNDIGTGLATTFSPISSTVLIGGTCPHCSAGICSPGVDSNGNPSGTGGPHNGLPCNSIENTDVACPPSLAGGEPVIPNPLNLSTETNSLSVPANSVTPPNTVDNPSGTYCGACADDSTIGCTHDGNCIDAGVCSGGPGCCVHGTNTGAFGSTLTTQHADGKRSPYLSQMGTIFCTGKSGNGLVDSTQGLPGPVRLVQSTLNAFQYPP